MVVVVVAQRRTEAYRIRRASAVLRNRKASEGKAGEGAPRDVRDTSSWSRNLVGTSGGRRRRHGSWREPCGEETEGRDDGTRRRNRLVRTMEPSKVHAAASTE